MTNEFQILCPCCGESISVSVKENIIVVPAITMDDDNGDMPPEGYLFGAAVPIAEGGENDE